MPEPDGKHWTLDKRVPLALLFAVGVQTAGIIWWGASVTQRLATLEERVQSGSDQPGRIIRLETKIESIEKGVDSIIRKLDQMAGGRP